MTWDECKVYKNGVMRNMCNTAYGFATFLKTPYSTLNYSNLFLTHNSNHLEPLEKIESPQLASLALGANKVAAHRSFKPPKHDMGRVQNIYLNM